MPWICARVCGGTAWADSLNFSGYVLFCGKSLSECEHIFSITITVLKISQNNDNRGCHLEFYFHSGIGNWFQYLLVYPGLNLSSGSGFGIRDSGFRLFHTPRPTCSVTHQWAMAEERRRQTLCDNIYASRKISVKLTFLFKDRSFCKRQERSIVKWRLWQNSQVIALLNLSYTCVLQLQLCLHLQ